MFGAAALEAKKPPSPGSNDMELKVARCRLLLSAIAIVAVYVDPTEPTLMPWLGLAGGSFSIDPSALTVMGAHVAYSVWACFVVSRGRPGAARLTAATAWVDVVFGVGIVAVTEGASSPFWAFFVFAVIAAGTRGGLRSSLAVTTVGVASYLGLIVLAGQRGDTNIYIMRPVYLAVVGYLSAYLAQSRLDLVAQVHQLATLEDRTRIARALHDGCVQTLAGVNLTMESAQALMRAGRAGEAMAMLRDLQRNITSEHDALRAYVRELANVEPPGDACGQTPAPRFVVSADFGGSAVFVEEVLQILREAVINVRRHAQARRGAIVISAEDAHVHIAIDDDGVGFAPTDRMPWSIASRVSDAGGVLRVVRDGRPGAHIHVALPQA